MKKELSISAIESGTVIDHIPSASVFQVVDILGIQEEKSTISIASNLKSKHMGSKGIIKIADKQLSKDEFNKIAIVAPNATVNIIKDFSVKQKLRVAIPDVIEHIIKCSNPNCITNKEQAKTLFYVESKHPLKLRCHYCERTMAKGSIQII